MAEPAVKEIAPADPEAAVNGVVPAIDDEALREAVWARVQMARNVQRPHTLELVQGMATDVVELHGDRRFGDDPALETLMAKKAHPYKRPAPTGKSVAVVGAGPAGLACALRLKQRDPSRSVAVIEKASEVGAHILSGAVIEPGPLDELVPGFGQDEPSSERYEFSPNRREFLHARYRLESESSWFQRFEAHLARQVMTDDRLTRRGVYAETLTVALIPPPQLHCSQHNLSFRATGESGVML